MDIQEMIYGEGDCISSFFDDQYYNKIINDPIFIDALDFFKKTKCHSKIIEFIINHENCTKSIPKDIIAKIICKKIVIAKYIDVVLESDTFFELFDKARSNFKLLQIRNDKKFISAINKYKEDNNNITDLFNFIKNHEGRTVIDYNDYIDDIEYGDYNDYDSKYIKYLISKSCFQIHKLRLGYKYKIISDSYGIEDIEYYDYRDWYVSGCEHICTCIDNRITYITYECIGQIFKKIHLQNNKISNVIAPPSNKRYWKNHIASFL
jgi:hypothetical protein